MSTPVITRPAADEHLPYYGKYIALVPGDDAWPALEGQLEGSLALLTPLDDAGARHRYAPEKWSVKETVGHLMDVERVFAYRALRFARADDTPLPGFDENAWMPPARFDTRPIGELLDGLRATRRATVELYRSLDPDAMVRRGTANNGPMSVRAVAWMICGHELHHRALLVDRYGLRA
jgi:uncharacterized damage-inducible protein DinB